MRVRFIHLSDLHFRSNNTTAKRLIDPLATAVNSMPEPVDRIVVTVTGDIAFSGNTQEYAVANEVIGSIRERLMRSAASPVTTALVPGNHDCNFNKDSAARKALLTTLESQVEWDPSIPQLCTTVQEEFQKFADHHPGSELLWTSSKLISTKRFSEAGQAITLWGINSAWMSQIKEQPGSIWFPVNTLQKSIESSDPSFNVLLLHHPFAWFTSTVRRTLLSLIDSAFHLVLGGHEHLSGSWSRDDLEGRKTVVVEGGAFQQNESHVSGSTFNVVTIDLREAKATIVAFKFDGRRYLPGTPAITPLGRSDHTTKPHRILSDKCASYLRSAGATFTHPYKPGPLELSEIFVEPDLLDMDDVRDANAVEKLTHTKDVLNQVNDQPHVVVGGAEKAGKSAWIRWAYLHLHKVGYTPVRIDGASIKYSDPDWLMKLIEAEYRQQYAVNDSVAWAQLDFTEKALLVDDFDASRLNKEARTEILSFLTMRFGIVLATCDDASILQTAGVESEFYGFKRYQLPEFGHRLRDTLIGKWLRLGRIGMLEQPAFQLLREQRVRAINLLLGQSFIPSRPIFLLTLLQSMEMGAEAAIRGSSLGEYYEYLIRHALIGARVDVRDLDAVLNYLTEMGYFFVSNDQASANSTELAEFDANFSKRYALNLNFESLHKQLKEADILEEWNDQVRFKYRYVLLFFGARYLARHFGHDDEVTRQVRALGRNLSVAKYANLMMFIVHHSNDPAVLDIVLEQAEKAFSGLEPLRLDQQDVATINELAIEIPRLALSEESTEKRRERVLRSKDLSEARKSAARGNNDGELSLSSLQEDVADDTLDQLQQVTYALRLLGILGQVLRNYYGSLRAERKKQIAAASYGLVGRMIRCQLDIICDDRDGLVSYIAELLEKKGAHTADRARSTAARIIFGLGSLIVFVYVKRASEFLGSEKLLPTHKEVSGTVDTPLSRLLGLAVTLGYPSTGPSGEPRAIPSADLEALDREFKSNPCAAWVLRRLVIDYLYMFDVSYKDKHRFCDMLGISMQRQQQIQLMTRRKKVDSGGRR